MDKSCRMTFDTDALDSVGQPTKSKPTIKPFFDRINEHDIKELNKLFTQIIVTLRELPNFKFRLSLFCNFEKKTAVEN